MQSNKIAYAILNLGPIEMIIIIFKYNIYIIHTIKNN